MRAILVLLAIGCGSKKEPPPAPPPAPAPAPKPVAPADAGKAPPTKDQLADYKTHMKAGWAHQKQKAWGEAVTEFEAALVALPADQRALSELGWSAMNAGDLIKARKADEEAVVVAVDPKVQASSYYNLGLVQDKSGDKDGAKRSYTLSLALRPNKTVHDALETLGGTGAHPEPTCELAKACDCIQKLEYNSDPGVMPPCTDGTSPLPGWRVVHTAEGNIEGSADYLLAPDGVVVGKIAGSNAHGRHTGDQKLDKAEVKTVAGHKVLWVESTDDGSNMLVEDSPDDDATGEERVEITTVTVCVLDGKTTCPLRDVPTYFKHDVEPAHGKPTVSETTADITIADDGTATVKLVKGPTDPRLDAVIGPHKLW